VSVNTGPTEDGGRRRAPRYEIILKVTWQSANELGQDYLDNLSEGGIRLETRTPFEIGQRLQLSLTCPGLNGALSVEGEVRWRTSSPGGSYQVGVAFCSLSALSRMQLKGALSDLPKSSAPRERPPLQALTALDGPRRLSVLVVDDDQAAAESLSALLSDDCEVKVVHSGPEALNLPQSAIFDVVCSDFQMPHMDGDRFLREWAKRQPNAERILVTGHQELIARKHRDNPLSASIVYKPYDPASIIALVRQLGRKALTRSGPRSVPQSLSR
jgi:CheY-like chemotaxis protein/Tfp pilus assembly protein PilZ